MKKIKYHLLKHIKSKPCRYYVVRDIWLGSFKTYTKIGKDDLKLIRIFDDYDEATQFMKALLLL